MVSPHPMPWLRKHPKEVATNNGQGTCPAPRITTSKRDELRAADAMPDDAT